MIIQELINLIGFKVNKQQFKNTEAVFDSMLSKMERRGKQASLLITLPILAIGGAMLKAASDGQETRNRFRQVYGDLADDADKWSENFAESLKRSDVGIKDSLANFQSLFVGLGAGNKDAFEFSQRLQKLAVDFSSFQNLKPEETNQRFISGLSGSTEVFNKFGIDLKAGALGLKAVEMGMTKSVAKMTELEKATLRLQIIEDTMSRQGAVGDAIRTLDDFANISRSAIDQVIILAESFGKLLIPVAEKVLRVFVSISNYLSKNLSPELRGIILVFMGLAAVVGPLLIVLTMVVKIGMAVKSVLLLMNAAAAKQSLTLALLIGKYLLLAVVMGAVLVITALLMEDILKYNKGQKSAIGAIIERLKVLNDKLKAMGVFTLELLGKMFTDISEMFDGLIEFIVGLLSGKLKFAFKGLFKSVLNMAQLLSKSILVALQPIVDVFNLIAKTKINLNDLTTNKDGTPGGASHNIGKRAAELLKTTPALYGSDGAFHNIGQRAGAALKDRITTIQKNFTIQMNNTIEVPAGTPETQKDFLEQSAETLYRNNLDRLSRELVNASPETE